MGKNNYQKKYFSRNSIFELIFFIIFFLNICTLIISNFTGDRDGKIEVYNFSEYLFAISIITVFLLLPIYSFRTKNTRPIFWLVNVNFYIFLLFLLITDLAFRLMESISSEQKVLNDREFRLSKPEPYLSSDYFSKEFIIEGYKKNNNITFFKNEKRNIIVPNDYTSSNWYNVKNNLRVTTDIPNAYSQNIYVFGGSTIWSAEVPDSLTICSILQRKINNAEFKARVYNAGVPAATVRQQKDKLEEYFKIVEDDLVVFYDGINDISTGVYLGVEAMSGFVPGFNAPPTFLVRQIIKLKKYSATVRYFYKKLNSNHKLKKNRIDPTSKFYCEIIESVNDYVHSRNGDFYHFFQPSLFTKGKLNNYEKEQLIKREEFFRPGLELAHRMTVPYMEDCLKNFSFSTNLKACLDKMENSPYLDSSHVNEIANEIIASHIFNKIKISLMIDI